MTATTELPRPRTVPTTGLLLWYLVPLPVRQAIRARVPLDCRVVGGAECLVVAVGSGSPLRWLHLEADAAGEIVCRLWEVRQKTREIGAATVHPDRLPALLQSWAKDFQLSAGS